MRLNWCLSENGGEKEIADACQFSLNELQYVYPEEITTEGRTPQEELIQLTWEGAREKLGNAMTPILKETIQYELEFIERKNYAAYFLTVYDFVKFARTYNSISDLVTISITPRQPATSDHSSEISAQWISRITYSICKC